MHGFVLSRTTDGGRKEYLHQGRPGEPRQFTLHKGKATCFETREQAETVAGSFINSRWTIELLEGELSALSDDTIRALDAALHDMGNRRLGGTL